MESGVIAALGTAAAGVAGIVAYYRRFTPQRRPAPPPVGEVVSRWLGWYKTGPVISPWTRAYHAQLEFFDWGIRVSACWPWQQMLPTWEFRYQELRYVQLARWPPLREGVRLSTDASAAPLVFITTHAAQILVQFAMRGVSVEQEVARMGRTAAWT